MFVSKQTVETHSRTSANPIVDYVIESETNGESKNIMSSNPGQSGELLIKPAEEWLAISDIPTNSTNYTCVGEPEYCNLTEEEYLEMIYEYLFPTPGEWVLIGCHTIVFLVGLVSRTI